MDAFLGMSTEDQRAAYARAESNTRLPAASIEKDLWVCWTLRELFALPEIGPHLTFKGGTSLSKGFGIIERFSEDLDLKIEPGTVTELPKVANWKSEGKSATRERQAYFEALLRVMFVPGAELRQDDARRDPAHRSAEIRVEYPGRHHGDLGGVLKPFVLLEVGNARVTPFVACDLSSFVHDYLAARNMQSGYTDNRPRGVRCVHPLVTLLEKLDALRRRAVNENAEPATFVRHYGDAARIVGAEARLPPLSGYANVRELAEELLRQRQIGALPAEDDPAFALASGPRTEAVRRAHVAIAPMFWGARVSLGDACAAIRAWIRLRVPG